MNIGFYGHSNCAFLGDYSFLNLVAAHFNAKIINTGVRQGSEERILFELKKTKDLDIAVIFHSEPQYIFLPGCDRDVGVNFISEARLLHLFTEWDKPFAKEHHKKFIEKFKTAAEFKLAMEYFKNYLYHPDIQLNRFYGSLIQIDQYLKFKKIPCIHVIGKNQLPDWFTFSTGSVNYSIIDIIKENPIPPSTVFFNGITKEGNYLVASKLVTLITEIVEE